MQVVVTSDPSDSLDLDLRWSGGAPCSECTKRIPSFGVHVNRRGALRTRHRGMRMQRAEAAARRFWLCLPCLDKLGDTDELAPV